MSTTASRPETGETKRNRQVISLPSDLADRVNAKGAEMADAVYAVTHVRPNMTLTDVAQALIAQALDAADVAATDANGTDAPKKK